MDINSTLIVQACNFIISYMLLKKILLRPATDAIIKDERDEQTIRTGIGKLEKAVELEEKKQQELWQKAHATLHKEQPSLEPHHFYTPKVQPFDERHKKDDNEKLSQYLTEKIVAHCTHEQTGEHHD